MPSDSRRNTGRFGEHAAVAHLLRLGYTIVAQNWRCSHGEIDLVAREGDQVVFVEVRTRRSQLAGVAAESVNQRKQQRLIELAYTYLAEAGLPETVEWRIDVIALQLDRQGHITSLEHIRYAVEA